MNHDEAQEIVRAALLRVAPGTDVAHLAPEQRFRDVLELDSLDFLNFVELLSERTGARIDEDDYSALTTLSDSADFLASRVTR